MTLVIHEVQRAGNRECLARDLKIPDAGDPDLVAEPGEEIRPRKERVTDRMVEGQSVEGAGVARLATQKDLLGHAPGQRARDTEIRGALPARGAGRLGHVGRPPQVEGAQELALDELLVEAHEDIRAHCRLPPAAHGVDARIGGGHREGEAEGRFVAIQHAVLHLEGEAIGPAAIVIGQAGRAVNVIVREKNAGRDAEMVGEGQLQFVGLDQSHIAARLLAKPAEDAELPLLLALLADIGAFREAEEVLAIKVFRTGGANR